MEIPLKTTKATYEKNLERIEFATRNIALGYPHNEQIFGVFYHFPGRSRYAMKLYFQAPCPVFPVLGHHSTHAKRGCRNDSVTQLPIISNHSRMIGVYGLPAREQSNT